MDKQVIIAPLIEDEELSIRWLAGQGSCLVLAFSGVKQELGIPANEFLKAAWQGGRNHVLFIGEPRPSWYSRAGVYRRIVEIVSEIIDRHGIDDVRAIGNSMGGYGALLFAGDLPVRTVGAFAPQISMDLKVIDEGRWLDHRKDFGPDLAPSVIDAMLRSNARFLISLGANDYPDIAQARLLPRFDRLHLFVVAGVAHDGVIRMKERGLLPELVAAKLDGNVEGVADCYRRFELAAVGPVGRLAAKLKWYLPRTAHGGLHRFETKAGGIRRRIRRSL